MGVPLRNATLKNAQTYGLLLRWHNEPNYFNKRDLWLLSAVSAQTALAIRNARLYQASQRRALEMDVINDVAHAMASTLNLDDVLTQIMDTVEAMLKVTGGYLLLIESATGDLVFQIALGDRTGKTDPFRIPKGHGTAGQVAQTGQAVRIASRKQPLDFQAQNLLCVPLIVHEKIIGVLEVLNKTTGSFTQDDEELLKSVAAFVAVAIENARLYDNLLKERDRVLDVEELARKDLARDLHDGPTQDVASIAMRLSFCLTLLEKKPDPPTTGNHQNSRNFRTGHAPNAHRHF